MDISSLLKYRSEYDVSTEAMFIRAVRLTDSPSIVFAAARDEETADSERFDIHYAIPSRNWSGYDFSGATITSSEAFRRCTAVGFVTESIDTWSDSENDLIVSCVGVPPYPGKVFPRIIGIAKPAHLVDEHEDIRIVYRVGDATKPVQSGPTILAHVVSDQSPRWGRGFGHAIAKAFPDIQSGFIQRVQEHSIDLELGRTHITKVSGDLQIAHLVAQHGQSGRIRSPLRYAALRACLDDLQKIASIDDSSIHMPLIGTGEAGGRWDLIEQMIDSSLCAKGTPVTVYELNNGDSKKSIQHPLPFREL